MEALKFVFSWHGSPPITLVIRELKLGHKTVENPDKDIVLEL